MYGRTVSLLLAFICLATGMTGYAVAASDTRVAALVLHFEEREAGTDSYPLRVLVTDRHVRFDDGTDGDDFVLLERSSRRLSSVSHEDRNILVVRYRQQAVEPPADLVLTVRETTDPQAPTIMGGRPVNLTFLANDEVCLQAVVVPGLLEAAATALAEHLEVLAMRELGSLQAMPTALRTPCFLSRHVHAPARHLERGLPVEEWDGSGYRRSLLDFETDVQVPAALFELPAGYTEFSLD